ncbi:hypothetical protein ATCC90586_010648 [Pythium insidiosum]|nr:hypothetical protein ATCC90586_010648 [Pythium insidiosum]
MLDAEYSGYLLSFDGAAKLKSNVGSASFVLWRLPAWEPVHAEGIHLEGVTVNEAEYHGMLRGLEYVLRVLQVDELVIAGDSRIVIQQCQGEINCNTPHLQLLLNKFEALRVQVSSLRLVHVKREFNAAADYLTGVVLKSGRSMEVTAADDLSQLAQLNTLPSKIMKPAAEDSETVTSHKQDDDTNDDVSPHAAKNLARAFSDADPELQRIKWFIAGDLERLSREEALQANGQQERSVQSVIRETPFFLMHGWDAKTTMSAMLAPKPASGVNKMRAHAWRVSVQKDYEACQEHARQLQEKAKRSRADERNHAWRALSDKFKTGLEVGDAVWLYVAKVKEGLSRKLAHHWHGPFRIIEKDENFMCKLHVDDGATAH